jgi:hypothetical protein
MLIRRSIAKEVRRGGERRANRVFAYIEALLVGVRAGRRWSSFSRAKSGVEKPGNETISGILGT